MSDDQLQIILMNCMEFQPRGVSCVSELDVAHLNNKQYVRKSYQSNMDLSKDLQLDANVMEEDQRVLDSSMACSITSVSASKGKDVDRQQRDAPPKPPRATKQPLGMSYSLAPDKMLINPNRLRQPECLSGRPVGSTTDHLSMVEAGSRLSSFGPAPNISRSHRHSRSKSESLRVSPIMMDAGVTQNSSSGCGEALLGSPQVPPSPSLSPTVKSPKDKLPNLYGSGGSSSSSKEDIRSLYCTLPRLIVGEKGMITGDVHTKQPCKQEDAHHPAQTNLENVDGDNKQANAAETDGNVVLRSRIHHDMLRELNTFGFKPKGHISPTRDVEEKQIALPDTPVREPSNKLSEETFLLDTPFTLSKMSRLNQSRKQKGTHGKHARKHSAGDIIEPRIQIRNSSFITHEEDGSILENKSVANLIQRGAGEEGGGHLQRSQPMDLFLSSTSELYKLAKYFDSEPQSPPGQYGGDDQIKNFQDMTKVDEADLRDKEAYPSQALPSPIENYRLSNITENLSELSENIMRDGFLHRTFLMRDGKKVRKNWTQSYTRFIVHSFNCGCSGILYFTKTRDDEKKPEFFEFYPPCYLEHASDKKTSRQQVLALRNGHDTEILLQFEEREIAQEWFKLLNSHEGVIYNVNMAEDKKMKKVKRETSMEQLSPDSKGIKDKLRNFIKRRPLKETLENKGIYKESVFGSTLAELKSQDKTTIPIFVLRCIQSIEKDDENLRTDGLYRISGNAAQIQKIRFEIAQRKYNVLSEEKEIHNLSGALKLFFRELKEPLIPFDNYEDFIRATGSEYRRMNQQSDKLTKAINRLPIENRDTLKVLMQHLLRVSEYESENRMSLFNLAIVFGPCLMWPKVTLSHDLMTDVMLHNRVVEGLLSDFSRVFSKR